MERERFENLAGIHGGDLRRWPEAARADAERLLDASPTPWPSQALRDRVIAAAPRPTRFPALAGWAGLPSSLSWSRSGVAFGAGWAAAACAGVVAGLVLTQTLTADVQADAVIYQASLNGLDDMDVLG